jgi:hypothetical protein
MYINLSNQKSGEKNYVKLVNLEGKYDVLVGKTLMSKTMGT